ncbi:efflux transporter outer membrane subunit [Variovorax sp. J31P179]|uniref:efflux transporter outer membrane subunit n=1 Tax=Variovorax sp. J31P179 TaxID=3053508 RepID=UPI0025762B56|nr:efflux transporter outer membrane subunit [Variovorax sp. J31P179]MDM0084641.1 efflux transporter outer membrane subunit [Variovorax sp. J31P179]
MRTASSSPKRDMHRPSHGLHSAVLAMVGALVLSGCSFGNIKPSSTLTNPAGLAAKAALSGIQLSDAHWPQQEWWRSFGDDQLNLMVEEALADSPSLRGAAARVRQAEALQGLAQSQLMPHVDGNLSSTRERFSENGTTPHPVAGTWQTFNQGTLNIGYELDFWGKNRATVEAALGRLKATEVDRYATQLVLSSAIVQAYIELQQGYEQLEIEQKLLKQQQEILSLTQRRFEAELDSKIDIKQAQASIPATRARIAALGESMELSRNKLAALLGKGPDRGRVIAAPHLKRPDTVTIPSDLPAELLGHRPDVVAQRWRVEAASHEIEGAKARFYPNVNLSAFVGLQSLGFDLFTEGGSRILGAGPAISLPIFEGGRLRANLASQDAAYDIAVEDYNQTLVAALHDISDQLSSIRWLRERIEQQQDAVQTANEAAELINKRYAAGLATYIQVLISLTDARIQQRQLVQLQSRGLALEANLSRALGGGYAPDLSRISAND